MLTPGNAKLGRQLIWGFGLPSGQAKVCIGMTAACRSVCYAVRTEQYRVKARARYEHNLTLTRRHDFVRRVRAFLIAHHVRVVRIHIGGDFGNQRYVKKWLKIIRRSPRVRFFTYTRAWRDDAIRPVLESMAAEPNCQMWFSLDRDTGWPEPRPPTVRLAWLMTSPDDVPPRPVDLVFRVHSLRRTPLATVNDSPVCAAEDGMPRSTPMTCDRCRYCWKPAAAHPTLTAPNNSESDSLSAPASRAMLTSDGLRLPLSMSER